MKVSELQLAIRILIEYPEFEIVKSNFEFWDQPLNWKNWFSRYYHELEYRWKTLI